MLQFRDCPHCNKRIRVDASRCHRCNNSVAKWDILTEELETTEQHLADGGYFDDDDFDYERFVEDEIRNRPRHRNRIWYWVAWLLIVLILCGGLASFF